MIGVRSYWSRHSNNKECARRRQNEAANTFHSVHRFCGASDSCLPRRDSCQERTWFETRWGRSKCPVFQVAWRIITNPWLFRHALFLDIPRSCGPTDKASDYESGDSRFESWQDRIGKCFSGSPKTGADYLEPGTSLCSAHIGPVA